MHYVLRANHRGRIKHLFTYSTMLLLRIISWDYKFWERSTLINWYSSTMSHCCMMILKCLVKRQFFRIHTSIIALVRIVLIKNRLLKGVILITLWVLLTLQSHAVGMIMNWHVLLRLWLHHLSFMVSFLPLKRWLLKVRITLLGSCLLVFRFLLQFHNAIGGLLMLLRLP